MKISEVTPFLLRGHERYGSNDRGGEATDQGDWLLLVRVRTDDGLEAWSDVETLGPVAARVINGTGMSALGFRTIAAEIVGRALGDLTEIWDELFIATAYYGRRGVAMHCMSAIDNCLWCLRAQGQGLSLATLLGGARRSEVPAYASTLFRMTPEDNASAARTYVDQGFRGAKFGWGGFGLDPGLDAENLAAVSEVLGPDCRLMVDPGWYVDDGGTARVRSASETATMLDTLTLVEPYWVEDFVHPECTEDYVAWKRRYPGLRFAAGEQQATIWELRRLVRSGGIDVVQPDLSRCGGLTVATQLIPDAFELDVEIVTHSWLTDLLHAYSLSYLAALPRASWVEFNVAQSELTRGVVQKRMSLSPQGSVAVPESPGIGVEIDLSFVQSRAVAL